jgi:hypothetical protein
MFDHQHDGRRDNMVPSRNPIRKLVAIVPIRRLKELFKTLKEYGVKPDESLKGLGLTIYFSKDGLLSCETTDGISPSCAISFNPPQLKIEPIPVCE